MSRSNWKGTISFGLVNIPIMLVSSQDTSKKVSFHQIDNRDHARIKYQRINSETGKEVPWDKISKGYQYDKETLLPVEENELKKVVGENARTIAIETFINQEDIHFIDIEKTYYLIPQKKSEKGYVILRESLKTTKKIGIAKVIISTKEYVAAVAYYQHALVLYLLKYNDEIKPLSDFDFPSDNLKQSKVTTKEIEIANSLIKSMTSKWHPEKYKDEYQIAVHKWATNKIKHKAIPKMTQRSHGSQASGKPINFIALLKKSLGENKKIKSPTKSRTIAHMKKKPSHGRRAAVH